MSSRTLAQVSSLGRSVGAMALCGAVAVWGVGACAVIAIAPWWPVLVVLGVLAWGRG